MTGRKSNYVKLGNAIVEKKPLKFSYCGKTWTVSPYVIGEKDGHKHCLWLSHHEPPIQPADASNLKYWCCPLLYSISEIYPAENEEWKLDEQYDDELKRRDLEILVRVDL